VPAARLALPRSLIGTGLASSDAACAAGPRPGYDRGPGAGAWPHSAEAVVYVGCGQLNAWSTDVYLVVGAAASTSHLAGAVVQADMPLLAIHCGLAAAIPTRRCSSSGGHASVGHEPWPSGIRCRPMLALWVSASLSGLPCRRLVSRRCHQSALREWCGTAVAQSKAAMTWRGQAAFQRSADLSRRNAGQERGEEQTGGRSGP